jgi:hypothetical protein
MSCQRVEPLLSARLERRLSQPEGEIVAAHLAGCPACRRRQAEFAAVGTELRELIEDMPCPELARRAIDHWVAERESQSNAGLHLGPHRFRKFLPAFAPPLPGRSSWRPVPVGVAAIAMLAVFSLIYFRQAREPSHAREATQLAVRPSPKMVETVPPPTSNKMVSHQHREWPASTEGTGRLTGTDQAAWQPACPIRLTPQWFDSGPAARPYQSYSQGSDGESQIGPSAPNPPAVHRGDDLEYLNAASLSMNYRWAPMPRDEWAAIEARVRRNVLVRDDFVQILFPRLASISDRQVVAAVEAYKCEAGVVDARLFQEVTLQFKGTALSDLCDHVRGTTGITVSAGPSVGDEKVTLFCRRMPLRDVMRQLSRPFGYTWLRTSKDGHYRYELVQDLRSQLAEEDLRTQNRNAALMALDRDIDRYRPYLDLSPDEALARARTATGGERKLLEQFARYGWGPVQIYSRLSARELAALRAGTKLRFSVEATAGEHPLPADIARGVLQSQPDHRLLRRTDGSYEVRVAKDAPDGLTLTAVPQMRAQVDLWIGQSEPGQFTLNGSSGFFLAGINNWSGAGPWATGVSHGAVQSDNAATNAGLSRDPALRSRVTLLPRPEGRTGALASTSGGTEQGSAAPDSKVTSAEVLEVVHRATGMPIVADYYTHLFNVDTVSTRNRPLFAALNQISDAMHMRWRKEGDTVRPSGAGDGSWLQFRSPTYFNDRLKEVPNRLLARWAAARQQHGRLTLDNLVEIAQLSDAQLDAVDMAEGARDRFGLVEWDLACSRSRRPHLRYLAELTPAQRQEASSASGLPFTKMSLPQQQRFMSLALGDGSEPLQSLEELAGATLRVDYTEPGWFEWRVPGPYWLRWVVPVQRLRRELRPIVRERSREAALQSLLRIDPKLRQALWEATRRADPHAENVPPQDETQIVPTTLDLAIVYIPDVTNRRSIHVLWANSNSTWTTW